MPWGAFGVGGRWLGLVRWEGCGRAEWPAQAPGVAPEFSIRKLYGDGLGLAIIGGIALGALILLLVLLRIYRAIPVKRR